MLHAKEIDNQKDLRLKAINAAGQLKGPEDLAKNHDDYWSDFYAANKFTNCERAD
jgi:hypothetical protein